MKVIKNLKVGLIVSVVMMLTVSACGRGYTTSYLPNTTYGTCSNATTGANTYTGTIVSCNDVGDCMPYETPISGSLVLSVYASGGAVAGQATITGTLTVNGSVYCCNSQGLSTLTYPNALAQSAGAVAVLNNVVLLCQPTSGGTGYFNGTYQTVTLRVGANDYAPFTMITSDQRLVGDVSVSSGLVGLSYGSDVPLLVQ